jgi:hypothetical protein
MPRGNPDKLIPQNRRTKQEQSEIARKGGIKSGKVRREKKLMSMIYAEFLDNNHDIIGKDGIKKNISGNALLSSVMSKVLSRGDSASVSLMKEIREGTEGSKLTVTGDMKVIEKRIMDYWEGPESVDHLAEQIDDTDE